VEPSGVVILGPSGAFSATGSAASITSGRFSYVLGLVGPCYTIDTACSSALAALHVSRVAIGSGGESETAIAVGTKVLSEAANYGTAVAGMTSARGRCHTFDGRADGYCRGEGCGAVRVDGSPAGSDLAIGELACRLTILGSAVQ
jgi:acyl transferase domain-containing protein